MPLKDIVDTELSIIPKEDLAPERQPEQAIQLKESYKLGLDTSDLIGAGMERDSLAVQAYDAIGDAIDNDGVEYDEAFDIKAKKELFDLQYKDKIHEDLKDDFMDTARSAKHMESMYDEHYKSYNSSSK